MHHRDMGTRSWAGITPTRRGLTPDERTHLDERARRQLRILIAGLITPILTIGVVVLLVAFGQHAILVFSACFLFGMIAPIASLMFAEDARKRLKGTRRDLQVGVVDVFHGSVKVVVGIDKTLQRLIAQGIVHPGQEHEFRVLPGSGYLLAVDGVLRRDYLVPDVLHNGEAAPSRTEGWSHATREFQLTKEEKEELRQRSEQLWRTPMDVFGLVAYSGFGAFMWFVRGDEMTSMEKFLAVLYTIALPFMVASLIQRYLTARCVARDAEQGMAIELRRQVAGREVWMIVLKESKLVWSADGLPAEWRSSKV